MKMKFLAGLATGLFLLVAHPVLANPLFVTDLINGTGNLPIPGNQAWTGQLGDDFTVNMDLNITKIGVFDSDGNGIFGPLTWQLFEIGTGSLVHTQTVAATGSRTAGTTIADNYVFANASSLISLQAGKSYSVVAFGFDNIDKNFNTNMNLNTLDVSFNTFGITSGGGRYSSSTASSIPMTGAGNSVSTRAYNFGAATFEYAEPVPEPATMLLMGTGLAGLIGARRKKKA